MSSEANNTGLPQQPVVDNEYGYQTDEVKVSSFRFGLNQGAFLTKFEWIPNGGKDGAEQEALDIVFQIGDGEKSYRSFPIVKVFGENNTEITDRSDPKFKEALVDFSARITHVLHCFVDIDTIKAAMSRPIGSFKDYCQIAASLLPKGFEKIPLDIFLQFQWQPSANQNRTFLEIPKKMKYGKWITKAMLGTWKEHRVESPNDNEQKALYYTNENGNMHLFVKNGWFMNSNFANQQKSDTDNSGSGEAAPSEASQAMNTGPAASDGAKPSAW